MGRIRCVHCKKSRRDFVARTFDLIALVHSVLHRVSCSYETIPNAPKHYATHQNMSLGSNGVDWVRSLRKIPTWLRGTNFRINCTSSPCFASSFMRLQNDPKCTQALCNTPKHEFRVQWSGMSLRNHHKCTQTLWNLRKYEFRVQWGGLGAFVEKNPGVASWHELSH